MRKSPLLEALFPGIKGDILAACILQFARWWYLTELADHLQTRPSSLQREVRSLTAVGILEQRREGTRVYLRANSQSPIFSELCGLVEKTAGIIPALDVLLAPFREKIQCAFIYGSVARRSDNAASDIDLMVIGELGLADLATSLRKAEVRLGREVNATVFGPREFSARARKNDHFIQTVLSDAKQFIVGDDSDLGTITGERRRAKASHVQAGTRQSA